MTTQPESEPNMPTAQRRTYKPRNYQQPRLTERQVKALIAAANAHLTDDPDAHDKIPAEVLAAAVDNLGDTLRPRHQS